MKLLTFIIAISFTYTAAAQSVQTSAKTYPEEITVPFAILQIFGNRPVIDGLVNGFPVKFVIHSNAGFSMQISHEAADKGKIGNRTHMDKYGIVDVGKVSDLGRDSAFVNAFTIKGKIYNRVPVTIFETPSPFDIGMLGLRWLGTNSVVVDYVKRVLILNSSEESASKLHQTLFSEGYVAIPMKKDTSDGRYLVQVTLNGVTRLMTVSTVADNTFDIKFADAARLDYYNTGGKYGGPTGTTGIVYQASKSFEIIINHCSYLVEGAIINDEYSYTAQKRPIDPTLNRGGMLAADFLIANKAVIDFGTSTLYLKKQASKKNRKKAVVNC